jgi:hypothetical protein
MKKKKVVAVMQPYLFPYLGYFQLAEVADEFVFYDDVDFIKQGWINRNRILINGSDHLFTVPCNNVSSNREIKEVTISQQDWRSDKLLKKIRMSYANAEQFDDVFPIVEQVISETEDSISLLAAQSVERVCSYLNLDVDFHFSSGLPVDDSMGRADRLIAITKHFGADTYVNMEGGKDLYDKPYFADRGVTLQFLETGLPEYQHHNAETFEPGLSIIDVMMNVEKEEIQSMLGAYQLK